MHFTRTLFVGASMVVAALAQSTPIAFTMTPAAVSAGQSYKLTWGGGDGTSPVTLILKQGSPSNLQTVALITGTASNGSYTWTVPSTLVNGNNYALQISQGVDDVNYSGEFALTGGATSSSASATTTTTTSMPNSMTASTTGAIGIAPIVVPASLSSILTSLNNTISSAIAAAKNNSSMTAAAAASAGTGVPMSRNTTMSMATLPTTSSGSAVARGTSSSSAASSTGASSAASTSSSGASSGSSTTGGAPASTSTKAGAAARLASPLALVLSAVAAIVYLG